MADNPNVRNRRELRTRKDIPNTVKSPSEKLTAIPLAAAPVWVPENLAPEAAAVAYTPAIGETRVIPMRTFPASEALQRAVVSSLVSLAKFARRKPATSLGLAAAAGFATGFAVRRI